MANLRYCAQKPLLGGELPTNRLGGLSHPGYFHGIFVGAMSTYNWGELTHLLSGMNHQVVQFQFM